MVRPLVAIDIDGTLGDYHGHLIEFATDYLGQSELVAPQFDGSEPFRDWFTRAFAVDVRTFRDIKLAYRQGAQKRSMPKRAGARALVEAMRAHGAEVWLTTTRPWERFDRVDPDTREWLRRHRINHDALLYDGDKYEVLADRVDPARVVAVLDDEMEQLKVAETYFGVKVPIVAGSVYNRYHLTKSPLPYAVGLANASDLIVNRIITWKEDNGSL